MTETETEEASEPTAPEIPTEQTDTPEEPDATTPESTDEPSTPQDVYYENCDEARAAGAAPLVVGEPGYRPELDREGDGIACEPHPGN
ncbi:excalibur calcium-binding domain-containing protein [Streptomyces lasiicapitis]|uniref:excalibur calcium-binding domain-containing protein n=1 Tax=Streptomyces lasiicapitis TaxID=1923961 RepID=UPI0036814A05